MIYNNMELVELCEYSTEKEYWNLHEDIIYFLNEKGLDVEKGNVFYDFSYCQGGNFVSINKNFNIEDCCKFLGIEYKPEQDKGEIFMCNVDRRYNYQCFDIYVDNPTEYINNILEKMEFNIRIVLKDAYNYGISIIKAIDNNNKEYKTVENFCEINNIEGFESYDNISLETIDKIITDNNYIQITKDLYMNIYDLNVIGFQRVKDIQEMNEYDGKITKQESSITYFKKIIN